MTITIAFAVITNGLQTAALLRARRLMVLVENEMGSYCRRRLEKILSETVQPPMLITALII